jgi:kinesin family protein C2/C3
LSSQKPKFSPLISKDSLNEESENEPETNQFTANIKVAMLEIYNEEIRDLLSPKENRTGLEIRRETNDSIAQIPGLIFETVTSLQDVLQIFTRGTQNRATAVTNMNEHSSRSHSILIIDVETSLNSIPQTNGRLYLVDLAGSERVNKSGVEGQALKEAQVTI